jgi:hypothetical protein
MVLLGTQELLTIPASWRGTSDVHEPLFQGGQSLELRFHRVHCLLSQFDPGLIRGRYVFDHGMMPFPGHGTGIPDHRLNRIQQGAIPVMFQNPPAAFNRVVFTVVRRIIGQANRDQGVTVLWLPPAQQERNMRNVW